jgi:beta-glucanase (GH16 family)
VAQYVPRDQAFGEGLAFWTQNGTPGIQAEHWKTLPVGEKRHSVRIVSKNAFAGGLFVFDMALLPHGCGVWPAVWMLGAGNTWPYSVSCRRDGYRQIPGLARLGPRGVTAKQPAYDNREES